MSDREIVLEIDGKPTGKGRPRFAKGGAVYTPAPTKLAEARVIETWINAGRPRLPDGPVRMNVVIAVSRPQTHWKVNGTLSAAGQRSLWPVRKPDADNALKLIMDALNGCAYRDDVDVVHVWVLRRWCNPGEHEHTSVCLAPMAAPILASVRAVA